MIELADCATRIHGRHCTFAVRKQARTWNDDGTAARLASDAESTRGGCRGAEQRTWVDGCPVALHFEVQARVASPARAARGADDLPATHPLAALHVQFAQVSVQRPVLLPPVGAVAAE